MPVIGCLEIFQNGQSPQPITGIIYSPGPLELNIGSAVEDTLGFIPLVFPSPLLLRLIPKHPFEERARKRWGWMAGRAPNAPLPDITLWDPH